VSDRAQCTSCLKCLVVSGRGKERYSIRLDTIVLLVTADLEQGHTTTLTNRLELVRAEIMASILF